MTSSIAYAMAAPAGSAPKGAESPLMMFAPFIIIFFIFYFLVIRPQQKKQAALKDKINGIKKGDKIISAGGIYGVVSSVKQNTLVVKIAENTKVEMVKSYVSAVVEGDLNDAAQESAPEKKD